MEIKVNNELKYLVENIDGKTSIPDEEVFISTSEPEAGKIWVKSDTISNLGTEVVDTLDGNESYKAPSVRAVKEALSTFAGLDTLVVDKLPEVGQKGIVYLVPTSEGKEKNVHDEYMWIESINDYECIGSTQIDLTGYVKNTDYASSTTGGVIKVNGYGLQTSDGLLKGKSYGDEYVSISNDCVVTKGTLNTNKEIHIGETEPTSSRASLWINSDEIATSGVVTDTLPVGTIVEYADTIVPDGWIEINGETNTGNMRIQKIHPTSTIQGEVMNSKTNSDVSTYSCDFINNIANDTGWIDCTCTNTSLINNFFKGRKINKIVTVTAQFGNNGATITKGTKLGVLPSYMAPQFEMWGAMRVIGDETASQLVYINTGGDVVYYGKNTTLGLQFTITYMTDKE